MYTVEQTPEFAKWLKRLKDRKGASLIVSRLLAIESGIFGDVKYFDGLGEMRVHFGPGYRVYFVQRATSIVVLLCAGTKGSQDKDIARAKKLAAQVQE